ncbi:hypothetical protein VPH35_110309 [Triticum aestivum]
MHLCISECLSAQICIFFCNYHKECFVAIQTHPQFYFCICVFFYAFVYFWMLECTNMYFMAQLPVLCANFLHSTMQRCIISLYMMQDAYAYIGGGILWEGSGERGMRCCRVGGVFLQSP